MAPSLLVVFRQPTYAASLGCTSRLILSAELRVATSKSYAACRFIQNSGVVPK